ncbi:MAG TPA: hypothetical protein VHP60_02835, partial [Thermoanaerobaculia bacterium]|nr:hypothetical protein [Thermoanaerobaculia bacterium]
RFGEVEAVFETESRQTTSAERLISSLSVAPARKARPVAVFLVTTVGVILLAAATIWARYCDRAPAKASSASRAPHRELTTGPFSRSLSSRQEARNESSAR